MTTVKLINLERIGMIGGLGNPAVRRIYANFVSELQGYLFLLELHRNTEDSKDLFETLYRLKGAAGSCGFVAIGIAAGEWHDAPDPLQNELYLNMRNIVKETIDEWRLLIAGIAV